MSRAHQLARAEKRTAQPHVDSPSALPRRRRPPLTPVQRRDPGPARCGRCSRADDPEEVDRICAEFIDKYGNDGQW